MKEDWFLRINQAMGMNKQPTDEEFQQRITKLLETAGEEWAKEILEQFNLRKLLNEDLTTPIWGNFERIPIGYFTQLRCCHCLYSFPYDEDFPEHFCPHCGMPIQWVRDEEGNWEYVNI